jgi:VIT1/CCC1 family predicted Fe2+/Mn2+ transporter/rubrerythrin
VDAASLRARLLKAWRGEVLAARTYELIRRRLPAREADIVRRMAETEGRHRRRLEKRMGELGIEIPPESSVRMSPWMRLQTRVAPVQRLLAAREAAEDEDIEDTYGRSTGDAATDALFRDLRSEEQEHAQAVSQIQAARRPEAAGGPAAAPPSPAQARLDRLLRRETWHPRGGGWISAAIYGANDGLASVFGIVAGVSGATGGSSFVLTAGAAGAIASALSMGTGAFLADRSESEVAAANIERERQEIVTHPEEEQEELSLFYQLKGVDEATANAMATQLSSQPEAMLRALSAEELGITGAKGNPVQSAAAASVSTGLGAIIPVFPFFFATGSKAIALAALISLVAHFFVGAAKSLVTLRKWWAAGFEMTLAGVLVGGITYLVGLGLPS